MVTQSRYLPRVRGILDFTQKHSSHGALKTKTFPLSFNYRKNMSCIYNIFNNDSVNLVKVYVIIMFALNFI